MLLCTLPILWFLRTNHALVVKVLHILSLLKMAWETNISIISDKSYMVEVSLVKPPKEKFPN